MWTLIGRLAMGLFLASDLVFFMRFLLRVSDLFMRWFAPITPKFLVCGLVPLFIFWFFFMAHFYLMPWLLEFRSWAHCLPRWKAIFPAPSPKVADGGAEKPKKPCAEARFTAHLTA